MVPLLCWGAFRVALHPADITEAAIIEPRSRWQLLLASMAVTWLNSHVYIDTFVVLGSLGGQLPQVQRIWFSLGACSASFIWFFGLALLAFWLSPWLRSMRVQRVINGLVCIIMWALACKLLFQSPT
ncbi:MAG: Arginine exporter protein ArgO [Candidatus Erwinia impunctatus]